MNRDMKVRRRTASAAVFVCGSLGAVAVAFAALLATPATAAAQPAAGPASGLANARVVFCGDSITGQGGGWLGAGYCFQMEWALKQRHPAATPRLVALGGSGMGVGNWIGVEKNSRTTEAMLDVKEVGVKANLDQPADVLVVMLGMNDVLAPYIGGTDADLDTWRDAYRQLVKALQERVHPKVTAICTITMYTEDPSSYKNRQIGRMNERLRGLAQELGAVVLPTGEACWEVQSLGRQHAPEFHITRDFIHPNPIGNQAVAIGMLRGLGEEEAARLLLEERVKPALLKLSADQPTISSEIVPQDEPDTFVIRTWWTPSGKAGSETPTVRLVVPDGWAVTPAECTGPAGSFTVKGRADRVNTVFRAEGKAGEDTRTREIAIAAPWLVAAGLVQQWKQPPLEFDPTTAVTPIDQAIEAEGDFLGDVDVGKGQRLTWQRLHPSVNLTGGADPGSVDYAAVTNGGTFEGGYAARWIRSDRDRPATLELSTSGLAARIHLTVWLNGRVVYQNDLTTDPQRKTTGTVAVNASLRAGENTLVIKSNHCNWQWQYSANLRGAEGDDLADLRYATAPRGGAR